MSDIPITHKVPETLFDKLSRSLSSEEIERFRLCGVEWIEERDRLRAELAEAQREIARVSAIIKLWTGRMISLDAKVAAAERDRDAAKAEAERLREALAALILDIDGKNLRINLDAMRDARAALQEKPHD